MRPHLFELEPRLTPSVVTEMVFDDLSLPQHASPSQVRTVGAVTYFAANSPYIGRELWKTDGTSAGTVLVRDVRPGIESSLYYESGAYANVGGTLYFSANDGVSGYELWKTDGTSAGTVRVKDINPGLASGTPRSLTAVGTTLFFQANDGTGAALWKTDGTANGTVLVRNGFEVFSTIYAATSLVALGNTLLFRASDGVNGMEMWRSDGTSAGTFMLKDITPGTSYAGWSFDLSETTQCVAGGLLFFPANDTQLWRTDGTTAGTVLVKQFPYYFGNAGLAALGANAFFNASDTTGNYLWKSNGTSTGTVVIETINGSGLKYLTEAGGRLYFSRNDGGGAELWTSDGTAGSSYKVRTINEGIYSAEPQRLTNVNGLVYFSANDGIHGYELWRSNGTFSGTVLVQDVNPGPADSDPRHIARLGGRAVFAANSLATGYEMWTTSASSTGANLIRDVFNGTYGAQPNELTNVGGRLFYTAQDATVFHRDVWTTDTAGTRMVYNSDDYSGRPQELTNYRGTLLYTDNAWSYGTEVWKTDGTSAGTGMVRDILVGGSTPNPYHLVVAGDTLYFRASTTSNGREVWRSNATSTGTQQVRNLFPIGGGFFSFDRPTAFGDLLLFGYNNQLWKTDGTSGGTQLVSALNPAGASPAYLTPSGGQLFFRAFGPGVGAELYRTDGTSSGTVLVKDINPGIAGSLDFPFLFHNVNGTLFFTANDGTGRGLWTSDGSATGTVKVKDITPAGGSSQDYTRFAANIRDRFFFTANDGINGVELWTSDGTSAGTVMVADINPGPGGSAPTNLTAFEGIIYFTADDGVHGRELWRSDGTSAGTFLVSDTFPGNGSANPLAFRTVGSSLYYAANNGVSGVELFRTRFDQITTSVTTTAANGTYGVGDTIPLVFTFSAATMLTGSLVVHMDSGGTVTVPAFNGTSITVPYTVGPFETSPDLNVIRIELAPGAAFTDAIGHDVSLALPALNLAASAALVVNPLPPTTVTAVVVNLGAAQRSRLDTLRVEFANPIPAIVLNQPGAIVITRTSGGPATFRVGATGSEGRIRLDATTGLVNAINLRFDMADGFTSGPGLDFRSLADGRWQLNIPALNYTSPLNDPNLLRLFGDMNGDGTVDGGTDFAQFQFRTAADDPFDFNGDGTVDGPTDFAEFGRRFGKTV